MRLPVLVVALFVAASTEIACASAPLDYCKRPDVLCMPSQRPKPKPQPREFLYGPVFMDDRWPIEAAEARQFQNEERYE